MASDLYKMGRLVTLESFIVRVQAAMLKHAQTVPLGGAASTEKNFAIWVLKNPMQTEISMVSLVASDPTVLAAARVDGVVADDTEVPDSAIQSAVAAKWSMVSTKFPVATAAPAP